MGPTSGVPRNRNDQAAGSSIGAFYGRFRNKTAALYCFYDARCLEQERNVAALLDPADPRDIESQLGAFWQSLG